LQGGHPGSGQGFLKGQSHGSQNGRSCPTLRFSGFEDTATQAPHKSESGAEGVQAAKHLHADHALANAQSTGATEGTAKVSLSIIT